MSIVLQNITNTQTRISVQMLMQRQLILASSTTVVASRLSGHTGLQVCVGELIREKFIFLKKY